MLKPDTSSQNIYSRHENVPGKQTNFTLISGLRRHENIGNSQISRKDFSDAALSAAFADLVRGARHA